MAVADLIYSIAGDSSRFVRALQQADQQLAKTTANMSAMGKAGAMLTAGLGAVGGYLTAMTKQALDDADALAKLSGRTGVAVEDLSRLEHALSLSDSSLEDFGVGAKNLNKILLDAETGNGKAASALTSLGIAATDATGKARPLNDVFLDVAEQFKKMPNGAEKSAAAVDIFGKAGLKLIPTLNSGKDGLQAMGEEAERLGLVLSTEAATAAELVNDNITKLQKVGVGLGRQIMTTIAPALGVLTSEMVDNAQKVDNMKSRQEGAVIVMKSMMIAVRSVGFAFQYAGNFIARFFAGFINDAQAALVVLQNLPGATQELVTGKPGEASRRITDALAIANQTQRQMEADRDKIIADYEADVERMWNATANMQADGSARMKQLQSDAAQVIEATKSNQVRLAEEMAKLREIFNAGLIDRSTFNARKKQLEQQFSDTGKALGKALKDGAKSEIDKISEDMRRAVQRIVEGTRTAGEIASAQFAELDALIQGGFITDMDLANRRARQIEADRDKAQLDFIKEYEDQAKEIRASVLTDTQLMRQEVMKLKGLRDATSSDGKPLIDDETYRKAVQKLGEDVTKSTMSDVDKLRAEHERLNALLQEGAISAETFESAMRALAGDDILTQLQIKQRELDKLNELLKLGAINAEEYDIALNKMFAKDNKEKAKGEFDALKATGSEAAKILMDSWQTMFFNPMEANLSSIGKMLFQLAMTATSNFILASIIKSGGTQEEASGVAGALGNIFKVASKNMAEGGYVAGPGTATSDSIPARLSNGEYVMPANTVRHFGVDFMDAIRAMRPAREAPVARFAEGGYVNQQGSGGAGGVRVVNVVDSSMVQDFLTSSAGEQVILNTIRRNRRQVSQVVG